MIEELFSLSGVYPQFGQISRRWLETGKGRVGYNKTAEKQVSSGPSAADSPIPYTISNRGSFMWASSISL
jgi:hypothetical protein